MAASEYHTQVYTMFVAYFGRPPAQSGLDYYANLMDESNGNWRILVDDFYNAPESTELFGDQSTEDQVAQVFQNAFGREPLAEGLSYWAGQVLSGQISVPELAYVVVYHADAEDKAVLEAKITTAEAWVESLASSDDAQAFQSAEARASAREFLSTVTTSAPASAADVAAGVSAALSSAPGTQAEVAADTTGGGGGGGAEPEPVGQTFTLTTGGDAFTGAAGDDTFSAPLEGGAATLGTGDNIDGGGGTDKLEMTRNENIEGFATATVSNVEQVYAQYNAFSDEDDAPSLNVSGNAGVTQVWVEGRFENDAQITLTKTQTAGIEGTLTRILGGDDDSVTFAFTEADGVDDEATLALEDADDENLDTLRIANIETLNITTSGVSDIENLVIDATDTINITGSGTFDFETASNAITTANAGTASANVTLNLLASSGNDLNVTTGTGEDTVIVDYATTDPNDSFNLGDGSQDAVLFLASGGNPVSINDEEDTTALGGITNTEVLGVFTNDGGATDVTVNMDRISQSAFFVRVDGVVTISEIDTGDTVVFYGQNDNDNDNNNVLDNGDFNPSAVTAKDGITSMDLVLEASGEGGVDLDDSLTINGNALTTVNLQSTSDDEAVTSSDDSNDVVLDFGADVPSNTVTINVSGDQDLDVSGVIGLTNSLTINASDFTAALTATGTNQDDIITGGSGNDTITGGGGGDVINGGEGADTFSAQGMDAEETEFVGAVVNLSGSSINNADVQTATNNTLFLDPDLQLLGTGIATQLYGNNTDNLPVTLVTLSSIEYILGSAGKDYLLGSDDANLIDGDTEDDFIEGLGGDDALEGGGGADVISGGTGNDNIKGGNGNDTLNGGDGSDELDGGNMDDIINGDAGDDTILGRGGNDTITGGTGADTIIGGDGADTLTGGAGDDTFVYDSEANFGDTITDFAEGAAGDVLDINVAATASGIRDGEAGVLFFSSHGINLITADSANVDDNMTVDQVVAAAFVDEEFRFNNLNADEVSYIALTADTDAESTVELYQATVNAAGDGIAAVQHVVSLQGVVADNLTADNFDIATS